jgi:hypothetical protein
MKSSKLPLALVLAVVVLLSGAASASAWAPQSSATIHPGVMTFSAAPSFLGGASQCTANFVYTDSAGNVYLGQAAHCTSTGANTATDGCNTQSLALGTPVYGTGLVNGGVQPGPLIGTLAYNSWLTMQARGEKDANTCAFNDLALIKVDPSQVGNVNPTVPTWGGPNGTAGGASSAGSLVYSYGNSILRAGMSILSPKVGVSLGDLEGSGGWSEDLYTVTPGIPGDSGSGYLDASGNALGVLSTVEIAPIVLSNGVGTLANELAYANMATGAGYAVANGTTPFTGTPSLGASTPQQLATAKRQVAKARSVRSRARRHHHARRHARARR